MKITPLLLALVLSVLSFLGNVTNTVVVSGDYGLHHVHTSGSQASSSAHHLSFSAVESHEGLHLFAEIDLEEEVELGDTGTGFSRQAKHSLPAISHRSFRPLPTVFQHWSRCIRSVPKTVQHQVFRI